MSDNSLKRQLRTLTIPVFIEMALVMMMGAVDTVMLSRYSDNSVAAVGLDNQLISLVFLVYQFFSMGAAILCAQYIGAGLRKRLVQVVGMALVVNLLLGLVVSALLYFNAEALLRTRLSETYGRIVVLPGSVAYFFCLSPQCRQGGLPNGCDRNCKYHQHHRQLRTYLRSLGLSTDGRGRSRTCHCDLPRSCNGASCSHTFQGAHPEFPLALLPSHTLAGTEKLDAYRHSSHEREHLIQSVSGGHNILHQPDKQ